MAFIKSYYFLFVTRNQILRTHNIDYIFIECPGYTVYSCINVYNIRYTILYNHWRYLEKHRFDGWIQNSLLKLFFRRKKYILIQPNATILLYSSYIYIICKCAGKKTRTYRYHIHKRWLGILLYVGTFSMYVIERRLAYNTNASDDENFFKKKNVNIILLLWY